MSTTPPPMPEFPDTERRRKAAGLDRSGGEELRILWRIGALGFQLAAIVGAGVAIGWLIDRAAGTGTRWTAICGISAVGLGMLEFIRSAIVLNRRLEQGSNRRSR